MADRLLAVVGSLGSHEATVLFGGPGQHSVESLTNDLHERFEAFTTSAPSDLAVTLDAVGPDSIDAAVIDVTGHSMDEDGPVRQLQDAAETPLVVLTLPKASPDLPADVTVIERRGGWQTRLEWWLDTQSTASGSDADNGTARDRYQRLLEQQNDRLTEFTGIVSHDLRNSLQVITSRVELARETGDDEHFDAIADTAEGMEHFLDDLLELARQGTVVGDPELLSFEPVVRSAWRRTDTIEASLVFEGPETVVADEARLRELLENLFANAVTHAGADVTVTVGSLPDGFFVGDDGPGIPADERESVFEHGYTTSEDGTGFGLAIVESIADAHGWDIDLADSDADRVAGACFELSGVELWPATRRS